MSLVRNTAGQFLYAVLINKNDGTAITTGATLTLAKDGAAAGAAGATLTHRNNGLWEAAMTQADSNAAILGYVWGGTDVIPQGGTIVTVDYSRSAIDDLPTANENADAHLARNVAGGSSTGRTVSQALSFLRNKWTLVGNTLTVYGTDDTTVLWTASVATNPSADPVISSDPA